MNLTHAGQQINRLYQRGRWVLSTEKSAVLRSSFHVSTGTNRTVSLHVKAVGAKGGQGHF